MKYCPYCGAAMISGAISFCGECGKKLEFPKAETSIIQTEASKVQAEEIKERPPITEPDEETMEHMESIDESELSEREYDGYYDDIKVLDADKVREGLDKTLIKRVIAVLAIVIVIIIMCVLTMYML